MRTHRLIILLICVALSIVTAIRAQNAATDGKPDAKSFSAAVKANADFVAAHGKSIVDVLYFVKYNRYGRRPDFEVPYFCPYCHEIHTRSLGTQLTTESPLVHTGFLVSETTVITQKLDLPLDCIDHIEIRHADSPPRKAALTAFFPKETAVELTMERPLPGTAPIVFPDTPQLPSKACFIVNENGTRLSGALPISPKDVKFNVDAGLAYLECPANTVLLTADSRPVTLSFKGVRKATADFAPPAQWQRMPLAAYEAEIRQREEAIAQSFYLVNIHLDTLTEKQKHMDFYSFSDDDDDRKTASNRLETYGMQLAPDRLLVFLNMDTGKTARFTKATVMRHDGAMVNATFVGSLRTFGLLVIKTDKPLDGTNIRLQKDDRSVHYSGHEPVFASKILHDDGGIIVYGMQCHSYETRQPYGLHPVVRPYADEMDFIFAENGELCALPAPLRNLQSSADEYSRDDKVISTATLCDILDSSSPYAVGIIPRTKEERKRMLVDFGVELQRMTASLVKAKKITRFYDENGYGSMQDGALVNEVTPGSLAAFVGILPEDILLYFRHPGHIRRFKIKTDSDNDSENFPWDEYDQLPEKYLDAVPEPWGRADTPFNRSLSSFGLGEQVIIGFIRNGALQEKQFTLTPSADTFSSAPRHADKALGLTVANLTPDVRKYFKLPAETAAVVIAKVKRGSIAAKAGLKPYELITSIDGTPVKDIDEFQKLMNGKTESNLTVRRLVKSRIVNIAPKAAQKDKK